MKRPKDRLTGRIDAEIRRRQRQREKAEADGGPSRYRNDPVGFCRDVLKVTLTNKQAAVLEALCRPPHQVMVKSANNVGKCVAEDDYLTLAGGERIRAAELVDKTFDLLTIVGDQFKVVEARAEKNVVEPVFRITTQNGQQITRSGQHPLWVAEGIFATSKTPKINVKGWTPVSEIRVGNLAAVTEFFPAFGHTWISDDEIKILGYLIGDGGFTENGVVFTQMPGPQLDEFRECAERLGCKLTQCGKYGYRVTSAGEARRANYKNGKCVGSPKINPIIDILVTHGLRFCHSRDKHIPDAIFSLPKEKIALFLSRLFSTDGWACLKTAKTSAGFEIGFCSVSERMVREIQELLLRFGVRSHVLKKPKVNAWVLSIRHGVCAKRFVESIGIYGKEKALATVMELVSARKRDGKHWIHDQSPKGTVWDRVASIELMEATQTVAIEVPGHNTYLTTFYEHNSFLSACAAIWFYMTRDPAVVVLTAPTFRQVVRVTFKEVRRLYGTRPGMMPKAPHIQTSEFHILTGFTAVDENSFQGVRELSNMIVFEECIGIDPDIWSGAAGILSGGDDAVWLAIHNPTDGTSQAYLEEQSGAWTVFAISAFEHPNIAAELCGERPPIPAAVRLNRLLINMQNWGEYVAPADATPMDVDLLDPATYGIESISEELAAGVAKHFPARHWRATTPEGDARLIGRYPQQSAYAIFSEGMFDVAERIDIIQPWQAATLPNIGCDVARFGDDATVLHSRRGKRSLGHESYRGKTVTHTAGRLKELARELASDCGCNPLRIPIYIDDSGVGGGVVDLADGFNFIGVNAASRARDEERYPNIRSEALFDLAETLASGSISLGDLPREARQELRRQAIGITYKLDASGRRVAEPKAKTKERLRRSPDDLDAFALAYYEPGGWYVPTGGTGIDADRDGGSTRRGRDGMSQIGSGDFGDFGVDPVPYQDGWNRR